MALCTFSISSFSDDVRVGGPLSTGYLYFQARIPKTTAAISAKAGTNTPITIWASLLRLLFEKSGVFLPDLVGVGDGVEDGRGLKDVDKVAPSLVNELAEPVKKSVDVGLEVVVSKADGRSLEDRERETPSEYTLDGRELLFARTVDSVLSVLSVLREASGLSPAQSTLSVNISDIAVHVFGGASAALVLPLLPQ